MARTITLTALDIGTTSIKVLVGQKKIGSQDITILGQQSIPCFGVRRGEIFNIEEVAKEIFKIKEYLEKLEVGRVKKVFANIGGNHVYSLPSQGLVSVSRADQRISEEDFQRILKACKAINLPPNKEILDIWPLEFIVDNEGKIDNPIGLEGIRLEARALLICVFAPILENLINSVQEAGFEIEEEGIIASPLASARAVLTPEQKELGAAVIEIGGGTTSLVVFSEGKLRDFFVFPIGSSNITNDIAICLRTEVATAERIKKEFGNLNPKKEKKNLKKIEIPEKSLAFPQNFLNDIIESRISQVFFEAQKELKKISKQTLLPAGVVLTGGGALLPGIKEFAKKKLSLPCYVSGPKGIAGLEDPSFSTCAGLLLLGFDAQEEVMGEKTEGGIKGIIRRIFETFKP